MLSPQLDPHPTHNDPQTQIDRLTNSIDALRPSSTSNQPMARSSSNLEGVHQPFQSHQDQNLDRLDPSDPIPDSHGNADDDDRRHHYYDPPIRLLFLDFEVQEELRFGLSQICDQSVRSNMNMIKLIDHLSPTPAPSADPSNRPLPALESIDPSTLRYFNQLINSSRSSIDPRSPNPNRSSVHSSSAQNHPSYPNLDENLTGPHDLQPEFWWFIQFSRDDQLTQNAFTIRTSHENFVDLSNTSTTYLIEVVESIASSVPSRDPNNSSLSSSSSTNHGLERFLINITYKRKCEAFRALGHLLGLTRHYSIHPSPPSSIQQSHSIHPSFNSNPLLLSRPSALNSVSSTSLISNGSEWNPASCQQIVSIINGRFESCNFESLGIMIDCSRNGVLKVDRVKELIRFISLMGLNVLQLYTEDTYEIQNEPFFGYFRGPYTQVELKEIDDYAYSLALHDWVSFSGWVCLSDLTYSNLFKRNRSYSMHSNLGSSWSDVTMA